MATKKELAKKLDVSVDDYTKKELEVMLQEKPVEAVVAETVVVKPLNQKVKVYGLCTRTYNIGPFKVEAKEGKTFEIPAETVNLLEGLKVVKRV